MEINVDSLARLAGALSLLALYRIGRGSGGHRARSRFARINVSRTADVVSPRGSSPAPGPGPELKRHRVTPQAIIAGVWIAASLLFLAYATIQGEFAVADLDGLDLLATYSWSPP